MTITPDPRGDNVLIGSIRRVPARGWGNAVFKLECSEQVLSKAVVEEVQIVACAIAFIIAKHLIKDEPGSNSNGILSKRRTSMAYAVDERRLLEASSFLFDNTRISRGEINIFVTHYSGSRLDSSLPRPPAFEAAARANFAWEDPAATAAHGWHMICHCVRRLGILLIALAHVVNLEDCEGLMIAGTSLVDIDEHPLVQQLEVWNGKDALGVADDAWLQALAIPLIGHRQRVWGLDWRKLCLISDRGWRAWISTFGDLDPALTPAGSIHVGRGSPCRSGVWKTYIFDDREGCNCLTALEKAESSGQVASPRCT